MRLFHTPILFSAYMHTELGLGYHFIWCHNAHASLHPCNILFHLSGALCVMRRDPYIVLSSESVIHPPSALLATAMSSVFHLSVTFVFLPWQNFRASLSLLVSRISATYEIPHPGFQQSTIYPICFFFGGCTTSLVAGPLNFIFYVKITFFSQKVCNSNFNIFHLRLFIRYDALHVPISGWDHYCDDFFPSFN